MELVKLACNNCGADIDVPGDARFVTCRFCSAKLEVGHTDGAAFTRVREEVARIAHEVDELRAENRVLSLKSDLERLDRDWNERREKLMIKSKDGSVSEPTRFTAVLCVVLGGGLAIVFVVMNVVAAGIVSAAVGAIAALIVYNKALQYERASALYQTRREKIVRSLDEARSAR